MASNQPAPEAPSSLSADAFGGPERTWEEWNPTAESIRPVRGKHRVAKQRGLARSSTVLGVGVIAAVGAGGMATAQSKPPVSISLPDSIADNLPDAKSLPGVGAFMSDKAEAAPVAAAAPLTSAGITTAEAEQGTTDAGEALRARILQQAEQQQAAADAEAKAAEEKAAAEKAAAEAKKQQDEAEAKAKAKAAAEKKAAEEAAAKKAEEERLAKLRASYTLPASGYTITSTYGQSGAMWSSGQHTGTDFAGAAGSPLKAVHSGTITSAGWSGSYGYRTVLQLEDGTELWYAHQSSIDVSVGQKVSTGDTIGRMGATGNVTGVHLHLEVRTAGGSAMDPIAWLNSKGLNV
ncbi:MULTISPECIES: M23 family metallopeptidase [Streptomyces]|uniref:M23 family metallopeptidase n=1 Tax=Streptomyces rhizosphaericola TaxID=2564098 RepID=A0ABY2P8Y4_9ACTN|nr:MULTISPECIES: M23 family metallopeptidase [Streptomyces]MYT38740.1 peptidoglycan DD-metalloendopeptidase family protein [Streptomyces sp. SID8356]MYU01059.1 peptidoglycan DD-metalloendopeptidase family protein [Streptomyces sp. SID8350]NGO86659.1 peptidoglycan DD-metalloendopeptidase family protein [Streptomyces sp. 196(2019)]ARI53272.1 peptidase [Streptomyces sp. S8]TGZ03536.1 M23 family metallopeptidase [Streptomyces rhizosphaericola]